jgi:hypothetical protein
VIGVHETEKLSLQETGPFLLAAKEVRFEASPREEVYDWVKLLLCEQEYAGQGGHARVPAFGRDIQRALIRRTPRYRQRLQN